MKTHLLMLQRLWLCLKNVLQAVTKMKCASFMSDLKPTNVIQFVLFDKESTSDSESDSDDAAVTTSAKHESQAKAKPLKGAKRSTTANFKVPKVSKVKPQPEKTIKAAKTTAEVLVAASDISTLPEFARATWSTHFLPTLYDCLGCSCDPFVINLDIIKPVQAAVVAAYPVSEYRVVANDRLITMVYKHLLICSCVRVS
jgi:hypothetical protein